MKRIAGFTRSTGMALVTLTLAAGGTAFAPRAATPALAQGETAVLSASEEIVGVGLTTAVTVDVEGVRDLYGGELALSFDPSVAQVVDAKPDTPGIQVRLGDFLDPGIVALNTADNTAGTIEFALTQLRPSEPKSGGGTLLIIDFEGLEEGAESAIVIDTATLVTSDIQVVPLTTVNGAVRVVSDAEAPPTPTRGPEAEAALVLPPSAYEPGADKPPPGVGDDRAPSQPTDARTDWQALAGTATPPVAGTPADTGDGTTGTGATGTRATEPSDASSAADVPPEGVKDVDGSAADETGDGDSETQTIPAGEEADPPPDASAPSGTGAGDRRSLIVFGLLALVTTGVIIARRRK